MKKGIIFLMLLFLVSTSLVIYNKENVKASTDEAVFDGKISPTRPFYQGENIYYSDFKMSGKFTDTKTGKEIPKDEWKIFAYKPASSNSITLNIVHLPSFETNKYQDIKYKVKIKTEKFSPYLISSYKDNTIFKNLECVKPQFKNSLGLKIDGDVLYSYNEKKKSLDYTFIPSKRYVDTDELLYEYNIFRGSIIVEKLESPIFENSYIELSEKDVFYLRIKNPIPNSSYNWYSDDPTNVSVEDGKIKAESLGFSKIYCEVALPDGESITLKCYVVVK
jgi:hypothetical protein